MNDTFLGYPVLLDAMHTESVFVGPDDPFVAYEERDRGWLLFFGMGHYQSVPSSSIYQTNVKGRRAWLMHPAIWEALKAELERQAEKRDERFFKLGDSL